MLRALVVLVALAVPAVPATAGRDTALLSRVFPAAESFGRAAGTPPAIPAYRGGTVVGYVLFTYDVVGSVGFSGKKLNVAVGLDLDGRITGAELVEHSEPILAIGVTEAALAAFIAQFRGIDVRSAPRLDGGGKAGPGEVRLDAVAGATVSSLVINDAVLRAARAVARSRGLFAGAAAALDLDRFAPKGWAALLDDGSLARLVLTNRAVNEALVARGAAHYGTPEVVPDPAATFIDLYVALATPAAIGRNLLGSRVYDRLVAGMKPGDQVVFVAARGRYSFKGRAWRQTGTFDRIEIVQGTRTLRLTRDRHRRVDMVAAAGAPELRETALFMIPAASGFDPTKPWRLDLLVPGRTPQGTVHVRFTLPYRVPSSLIVRAADATGPPPLWQAAWWDQAPSIVALAAMLVVLTLILVFQDAVVQRPRVYRTLRLGFLAVTLVWLGWVAGAQLSVVNVLTFAQALISGFRWEVFLVAPLVFILWSYVAVTLLFWGRGVLCGWLCPFGALQDLATEIARWLGVRQIQLPFRLHERLWPIKYVVFLGLFALSLGGLDKVQWAIEVEPFKTAIILPFGREWPFVAYAVALVAVGLVIERAFCRYLCPLGAALAIPARIRMFEWLKRKRQCGTSCQACAQRCPVQAIHPEGQINPNECVYCLHCQMLYYDEHVCPPLIGRRQRREAREKRMARERERAGDAARESS